MGARMPDLSPLAEAGLVGICIACLILCAYMAKLLNDATGTATSALVENTKALTMLTSWLKETMPMMLKGRGP